jgi:hypothetical protein
VRTTRYFTFSLSYEERDRVRSKNERHNDEEKDRGKNCLYKKPLLKR